MQYKIKRFSVMIVLFLLGSMLAAAQGASEEGEDIFTGTIDDTTDPEIFELPDLREGDIVYAWLQATSGDLDTYLLLTDESGDTIYAENDDVARSNTDSALVYRIQDAGNYYLLATRFYPPDDEGGLTSGDYELRIGINAPDVFPVGETRLVQEETGTITDDQEYVFYDLEGLTAGDTVYAYVEAAADLDTYLYVGDVFFDEIFVENDDVYAGNTDSALFFTVPADGDYSVAVTRFDETTAGDYRFLLGINMPQVLSGDVPVMGDTPIAFAGASESLIRTQLARVQQFRGEVTPDDDFQYYDLFDMEAGQTIYIYAEGLSDGFDTLVGLGDYTFETIYAENDDIDIAAGNTNSALEYTFTEDGDYSIGVGSALEGEYGSYRLLIGLNAPDVLDGSAAPTNDLIAVPFDPDDPGTGDLEIVDCATVEEERPVLSGDVDTVETDRFAIHYTTSGVDATTAEFAQAAAAVMDDVWTIQIDDFGWDVPPPDCGEGGSTNYDVYLMEVESQDMLGYAQPEGLVGDNPSSPAIETYAAYSYLVLDNDFSTGDDPLNLMKATAAHEFHHGVQFGYDLSDPSAWYYESTATWMETVTFEDAQDATGYTFEVLTRPGLCVGNVVNDDSGLRYYGEWLFIDSLVQDFGDVLIADLWNTIAIEEDMQSLYTVLDGVGTTPQEAVWRYAIRNLLLDYTLADLFDATVRLDARITDAGRTISRGIGVQELGVNYLRVLVDGVYTFEVDDSQMALTYIGIRGAEADTFDLGTRGTVDTSPYDDGYLLVMNTATHETPDDCNISRWVITVSEGGTPAAADSETWSAANFRQPD